MKVYGFKVVLEPEPDGGYVVSCPSLRGCYSEGETVEKALANIKEAIELVLEDMKAHEEPIPDPSQVLVGSVVVTHEPTAARHLGALGCTSIRASRL